LGEAMVGASSFVVPGAELDGEAVLPRVDDALLDDAPLTAPLTAPLALHPAATAQATTAAHATKRARRPLRRLRFAGTPRL
jgi:hypothetical protein